MRLLSSGWLDVLAVGGAVRNQTGHWRMECRQMELSYYRLELEPGYTDQHQDCMLCDYVGGPVMLTSQALRDQAINNILAPLSILDLAIQSVNTKMLACPDIMFFTRQSVGRELFEESREHWQELATKHQFQGVKTEFKQHDQMRFNCSEVGMKCNIREQAASFLVPWCCMQSFQHIVFHLETISQKLGIEYGLDSGSALGAVKLGNFIPWDIDMDIDIRTQDIEHFKPGGEANKYMTHHGIELYSFKKNMYAVKGAGSFWMWYEGIEVEMLGTLKPLSRVFLPQHLRHLPTRIELAPGVWSAVTSHPGLYCRGRYGPGYLYHVQSWRYKEGMRGSYDSYHPTTWQACSKPGHHACLNNYPVQGNTKLLFDVFPGPG